jgi:ribonuclease BN (tRNA processing enzyme)
MLPPVFPVETEELRSLRVIRNVSESEMIVFSAPDAPPQVCNVYRQAKDCPPWEARVRIMRSYAHPQGVLVYRIEMGNKKLVFATDVEGYAGGDRQLTQFARGADLLIHDAEFTPEEYLEGSPPRQGWGHSTWEMAVETALATEAKKLVLTHHNARHDDAFLEDIERRAQALFPAAVMAYEGLTLKI